MSQAAQVNHDVNRSENENTNVGLDKDDVNSKGIDTWEKSNRDPNNLHEVSIYKVNFQEWVLRIQKYKSESTRYAQHCRILEKEIRDHQNELEQTTENFERMDAQIEQLNDQTAVLLETLQEETVRRNNAASECVKLRHACEQLTKQADMVERETSNARERLGFLKSQLEQNQKRHEATLEEKERLKFERRWFFHERLLLEQTKNEEIKEIEMLKNRFKALKEGIDMIWKDTKEGELLVRLQKNRRSSKVEEWYAARRRRFGIPLRGPSTSEEKTQET